MSLILGIDLGTTAVKVALIDSMTKQVINLQSENTNADIVSTTSPIGNEQSHTKIFNACIVCLHRIEYEQRRQVVRIAVSGQMHGIILWSSTIFNNPASDDYLNLTTHCDVISPLYTWQDARCSDEFLATLPPAESHLQLATGHGCATLFWLKRNVSGFLFGHGREAKFDCAGTIMDFFTAFLCGLKKPIMSVQNAASWGYYNTEQYSWNEKILKEADFPVTLLPEVRQPGCKIGELRAPWQGLPQGTDVGVAMGDLQCSILPHLTSDTQAVVNIGTSMQAVFKCPPGLNPTRSNTLSSLAYFPFFKGTYLTVAASLNGGNVLTATVKMFQQMMQALNIPEEFIQEESIFDMLLEKGKCITETDLVIKPTIHGERHAPNAKGSVTNITPFNMDVGHLSKALCRGLIENLLEMLPREILCTAGVERIVGCGSALLRNKMLQEELERAYCLPVELTTDSNAAVGGAIALLNFWH
ncbi:sedoheptulokinase-like [Anneissia japonica]|uniref:sedoheptulokinase-like n=1 Tax=Anneissia japonica TaxID=1529436 RepID=UPI001425B287|nr:sedoheptulokinase-like [Anneissia japonica]XP_033112134.1 sedoheptulokinase-like [Anneissia japonica]XP_033112135.1 sedoheptulokinase-like [Anneissia japonica]